ncbi:hypothetical protein NB311A_06813 [Nitrobacter sp. Nb-311A]|nr:hypothetical protein NB311A_06813 [Nitrobacter sp. Nb-311A]
MSSGTLSLAIRTVEIDRGWRIRSVPRPVIAGVHPQPASFGAAAAGIEYRDRRVVGEQFLRCKDVFSELGLKGLQPPAGAADPVRQGRAVQRDALPGEDLALPVKREVIAVFGDQNMGEQSRGGQPFGDRPLWCWRLMDSPAGPTAIARPADSDDPQPRRYMVEHLARRFADQVQYAAATRAGLMLNIEPDILAGQVHRQARALALGPRGTALGWRRRKASFDVRKIGVEVFEAELQLLVIEPLSPAAVLVALQPLDDEIEPFDLGLRLAEADALGYKRTHQLLQRLHVVGQCGEIDVHTRRI